MTISPSISRSRYLRLGISLTVSNFIGAPQGAIPPPLVTRTIDTQVNVPDGDTMVIGGIVVDDTLKTRSKIPLLGDIPLLGALFRRDSSTRDRTALYFFVTPHILEDRDFADLAEYSNRKKVEAADTIGRARVQMIDPTFGSEEEAVDLSGFDLPTYRHREGGEVSGQDVGRDPVEVNRMIGSSPDGE